MVSSVYSKNHQLSDLNSILPYDHRIKSERSIFSVFEKYMKPMQSICSMGACVGYLSGRLSPESYRSFVIANTLTYLALNTVNLMKKGDQFQEDLKQIENDQFFKNITASGKQFFENRGKLAKNAAIAAGGVLGVGAIALAATTFVTESVTCPELIFPNLMGSLYNGKIQLLKREVMMLGHDEPILKDLEENRRPKPGSAANVANQAALIRLKERALMRYERIVKGLADPENPPAAPGPSHQMKQFQELLREFEGTLEKAGKLDERERVQKLAPELERSLFVE